MIIEGKLILEFKGCYEDFIGILLINDYEVKSWLSEDHKQIHLQYKKIIKEEEK